jgi:hypothetical protein
MQPHTTLLPAGPSDAHDAARSIHACRLSLLELCLLNCAQESWGRDSEPKRTLELPLVSLWARPDTSFARPKARTTSMAFSIQSKVVTLSKFRTI